MTQSDFEQIVRDACNEPFGPGVISMGAPPPSEENYLYAIWYRVAKHIKMDPAMLPANGRTKIELLREEIQRLVEGHQSGNYQVLPKVYEHVNTAMEKSAD